MSDTSKDDDETKFNETLKRMLQSPPKPHNPQQDQSDQKRPKVAKTKPK